VISISTVWRQQLTLAGYFLQRDLQPLHACLLLLSSVLLLSNLLLLLLLQGVLPPAAPMRQFLPAAVGVHSVMLPAQQAAAAVADDPHAAGSHPHHAGIATAAGSGSGNSSGGAVSPTSGYSTHRGLSPDRLWLLKMYGRVYLAHADASCCRLELYRFYTDTIMLQHIYELCSPQVRASGVRGPVGKDILL
jgi:hypothetical protein